MKSLHGLVGLLLSASLASARLVPRDASIPIVNQDSKNAVPNRYLVAFDPRLSKDVIKAERAKMIDTVKKRNVGKRSTDNRPLSQNPYIFDIDGETQGMIIEADDATIQTFAKSGALASIECDTRGSYDAQVSQSKAPGNLVRLSNNVIEGNSDYKYDESGGEGITVYVFDGGIRLTHEEFGGRATFGASFITDSPNEDFVDDHGTHVAGIIGGAKLGVAKNVQIVAVKIHNKASQMIQAVDFVLEDIKKKGIQGKAVISMSMHNDPSDILDQKFKHAVDSGVVVVVSAGNNNADAGNYSPGRHPSIITVAAMYHDTDFHWPNSNWGSSVTIYAPGVGIESAATWTDNATSYLDGTSQAAPHVAGVAAYIMALEGITEPAKVMARLISLAEETGSRVHWTDPNTTTLVVTNGLAGKLDPSIANKIKLLPYISVPGWGPCGFFFYSDQNCGTLVYCNSYDLSPTVVKKGFFKSARECFDAHERAPLLPWLDKPTTFRPDTCDKGVVSDKCPRECGSGGYDEYACGSKFICEGSDLVPQPYWANQYQNAKACFDAHEPRPVSSNETTPAIAA